jgi:hypothetical protein
MLSIPPKSDDQKENGAHQTWDKRCFQFHPSAMSTTKTVLIGLGKTILLSVKESDTLYFSVNCK